MPKVKISEFSSTPANNTDIDSINLAEGCAPSGINDAIRELMAQLKDFQTGAVGDSFNGPVGTSTAAAGAFTTLAASGAVTLSGGTANGVAYLNGSKVVTSGSALVFDGTNLGVGTATPTFAAGGGIQAKNASFASFRATGGASTGIDFAQASDGKGYIFNRDNADILFGLNNAEQMRLTSTGLGIGTSSPSAKLDVNGTIYSRTGGVYTDTLTAYSGSSISVNAGSSYFAVSVNSSERMRLDSSGNLGLGVTPSALDIGRTIQVGFNSNTIWGATANNFQFLAGATYNNAYLYAVTGSAVSNYRQNAGQHQWFNAPSGTAGNAITFTQAMTLTSGGNLLVGCTSFPSASVAGIGIGGLSSSNASSSGASTAAYNHLLFYNGNGIVGSISTSGSSTTYSVSSDYRLKNITGPITSSGAYIDSLNPVEGTWKADGSTFVGLIAHEVQEASRTTVATGVKDGEEMQGMDYSASELIANLIAEVKSLRQRVATLEAK